MELDKIELLFKRYLQNQCSPEEIKLFFQYFDVEKNERLLKSLIKKELGSKEDVANSSLAAKARIGKIFEKIKNSIPKTK